MRCAIKSTAGSPIKCVDRLCRNSPRYNSAIDRPSPQPGHQSIPNQWNTQIVKCSVAKGSMKTGATNAATHPIHSRCEVIFTE